MTFDLIANERLGRKPHRLLDELDGEIGHPDMARQPIALDLAQRAERIGERDLRIGPVQQQQIEFAQAQPAERVARGPFEIARRKMRRPDLGGDKHVAALDARGVQALPHFALIVVHLRRIDVAVAEPQRLFDHAGAGSARADPRCQAQGAGSWYPWYPWRPWRRRWG